MRFKPPKRSGTYEASYDPELFWVDIPKRPLFHRLLLIFMPAVREQADRLAALRVWFDHNIGMHRTTFGWRAFALELSIRIGGGRPFMSFGPNLEEAKIIKLEKKVARLQRRCRELLHPDYGMLECAVTEVDHVKKEMEIRPVDPDPVRRDIKTTIYALTARNLEVWRENQRLNQEIERLSKRGKVNFLGVDLGRKDP